MFVRCVCGKIHVITPSGFRNITCPACGQDLWGLIIRRVYQSDD